MPRTTDRSAVARNSGARGGSGRRGFSSALVSFTRRKLVDTTIYIADRDRSGRVDGWLASRVLTRETVHPGLLRMIAVRAEKQGQVTRALELWRKYLTLPAPLRTPERDLEALTRSVTLETRLARAAPAAAGARLDDLWAFADARLDESLCDLLHARFLAQAGKLRPEADYGLLLALLAPLRARRPADPEIYGIAFALIRTKLLAQTPDWRSALDGWWGLCAEAKPHLDPAFVETIGTQLRAQSRKAVDEGRLADGHAIGKPLPELFPEDYRALNHMARLWEAEGDWRRAAACWQLSAATTMPVSTSNGAIVTENPEEALRRTRAALKGLRSARLKLAAELHAAGRTREFTELVSRAVESLPEHRMMKKDPEILELIRLYVDHALTTDRFPLPQPPARGTRPRRIAFCVDVLKVSDHYTHSKILFAMCRNLLALDPEIETHIIVTHERLAVSTPMMSPAFNLTREGVIEAMAQKAMPEHYGTRMHVHFYRNFGLEGIVDTCKSILTLQPDVMVYGGGHIGLTSNESRVVRHCLHDHLPTAFFFIQANNQVDEKLDMIIARGPHAITGDPGKAKVRAQPYPTITDDTLVTEPVVDRAKSRGGILLSAVAGVRMDLRMQAQNPNDLKQMFRILDDNPGTVWHFVGSENPEQLANSIPLLKKRVAEGRVVLHRMMPFETFERMATNAALFLQLPGFTGGSGGAGIARRAGVPILTFEHSDVSGRQPEETIFAEADVAAFARKASALLRDADEWERVVRLQFAHSVHLRESAPQGFYDCLAEACDLAQARISRKRGRTPRLTLVKETSA